MVRTFERGLSRPTGFVLPVQRWNAEAKPAWRSERWPLRRGKLFLVPGDSPVGLRLPMKTLPHVKPSDYPVRSRAGPAGPARRIARADAVPPGRALRSPARSSRRKPNSSPPKARCAPRLTVEPRDGVLCVFMPPTPKLDDYLELLGTVEAIARERNAADPHRGLSAAVRSAHRRASR